MSMLLAIVDRIVAAERHVFGAQVSADSFEQGLERHATPFADHAPAFHADVARHVRGLRH